jgi:hypothetical protein
VCEHGVCRPQAGWGKGGVIAYSLYIVPT